MRSPSLFGPASKGGSGESVAWMMRPLSRCLLRVPPLRPSPVLCPLGVLSWAQVFLCLLPQVASLHCRPRSWFLKRTAECTFSVDGTTALPLLAVFTVSSPSLCSQHLELRGTLRAVLSTCSLPSFSLDPAARPKREIPSLSQALPYPGLMEGFSF